MKKIKDVELKDNRNLLTKAVEFRNKKTNYEVPLTLGRPKKDKQCLAMDACIRNVLHGFTNDLMYAGAPKFLGYAMLSNISQEALIRAGVDTVADECTRKFYKLRYVDEKGGDHEDFINEINEEAERLHLKKVFNRAFKMTGYYGGCLGYIDVGDIDDEEKKEPLILDKKTIKKGMIKGIKLIEPINIYPGYYNTTDPTADDYFVPQSWYVLGKEIHASRFLYFSKNEAPLLLKPAYNFFGIPDAQLVLDYVAHFVENRESAQELLHKFSLTCFGTDMAQQLQGASFSDLKSRIGVLNKFRNNNGTFVFDKEKEEITQLNTPLGGVREIVDMSLNLLCAIFRIPKIRLLGEGEGGLNASSVEQTRVFYDYINATKEVMARNPLTDAIKLCQLNLGYEPDENLKIDFPALWEMDDKEKADLNKTKADRDIAYINAGVLSQEEVRQSLSLDSDSGYDMIDADDLPETNEEDNSFGENEEKSEEKENDEEDYKQTTNDEIKRTMLEKIRSFFHRGLDSTQQKELAEDKSGNFGHFGRIGFVGGSRKTVDLSKSYNLVSSLSPELIAGIIEGRLNSLIKEKPFNTKTDPFKIKIDLENKHHIIDTCVNLSNSQKRRHRSAILELDEIIKSSYIYGEPELVDLSHNTNKKTIEHKMSVEKYYTFLTQAKIGNFKYNIFLKAEQPKYGDKSILSLYNVRVKLKKDEPLT